MEIREEMLSAAFRFQEDLAEVVQPLRELIAKLSEHPESATVEEVKLLADGTRCVLSGISNVIDLAIANRLTMQARIEQLEAALQARGLI